MDAQARALADHCQRRVDEGLRAVYTYGPDGHAVIYARDDIDYGYTDQRLATLLDGAADVQNTLTELGTDKEPLGAPQASVLAFEHAFVVLFMEGQEGVAVAVDREVGPEISSFLESCAAIIERTD